MLKFRRLTAPPPRNDDEEELEQRLARALRDFDAHAQRAGLSWLDKQHCREQLLDRATVAQLPRVERLNAVLARQAALAAECLARHAEREALIGELLECQCGAASSAATTALMQQQLQQSKTAFGGRFAAAAALTSSSSTGGAGGVDATTATAAPAPPRRDCSAENHRAQCERLRAIDDLTDAIVALVAEWRRELAQPLPFFVDGENVLTRMAAQTSLGKPLAHVCAHLRSTSRHAPFFYSSSYDPVVLESNAVLRRPQLRALRDEQQAQVALVAEQLRLARMGVYAPVLRLMARRAHAGAPPSVLMLDRRRWKTQLVASLATALHALRGSRPQAHDSGVLAAMLQVAALSHTVLHLRYFQRWADWIYLRRTRAATARGLAQQAQLAHARSVFSRWFRWLANRTRVHRAAAILRARSENALRARYMHRLFLRMAMRRAQRLLQRQTFLRYFHKWLLRAARTLVTRDPRLAPVAGLHVMTILSRANAIGLRSVHGAFVAALPPPPPLVTFPAAPDVTSTPPSPPSPSALEAPPAGDEATDEPQVAPLAATEPQPDAAVEEVSDAATGEAEAAADE